MQDNDWPPGPHRASPFSMKHFWGEAQKPSCFGVLSEGVPNAFTIQRLAAVVEWAACILGEGVLPHDV